MSLLLVSARKPSQYFYKIPCKSDNTGKSCISVSPLKTTRLHTRLKLFVILLFIPHQKALLQYFLHDSSIRKLEYGNFLLLLENLAHFGGVTVISNPWQLYCQLLSGR